MLLTSAWFEVILLSMLATRLVFCFMRSRKWWQNHICLYFVCWKKIKKSNILASLVHNNIRKQYKINMCSEPFKRVKRIHEIVNKQYALFSLLHSSFDIELYCMGSQGNDKTKFTTSTTHFSLDCMKGHMEKKSLFVKKVRVQKNNNSQSDVFAIQLCSNQVSRGWEFNQSGFVGLGVWLIRFCGAESLANQFLLG